jgi:hypothetical protein
MSGQNQMVGGTRSLWVCLWLSATTRERPAEVAQLHHAAQALVDRFEPRQGLVHEGRGSDRAPRAFPPQLTVREPAEGVVDEDHQPVEGFPISFAPGDQQLGDITEDAS